MTSLHSSDSNRKEKLRLAVLVSGGGTNLQALLDRVAEGFLAAEIVVVVSDRPDAYGLVRAKKSGVPAHVIEYGTRAQQGEEALEGISGVDFEDLDRRQRILTHPDREVRMKRLVRLVRAEQELIRALSSYAPDYICLAGYMRLVTPFFLDHFNREGQYRVLNIHPALLPAFPGGHGYEDTFAYGCKWGGVTVHFVDEGEDSGPIIAQAVYPIWPEDDLKAVRERGLQLEYEMYSQCIDWLAKGQVEIQQNQGGRPRVLIKDPMYSVILQDWMRRGLQ
jgi:phosphoribosylglycinamide formyltransferase-1